MKMRGKYLIYLFLFILLVSTVSALSEIEVNTIDNRVMFGEKALFRVVISNLRSSSQDYTFSTTSSLDWSVRTSPIPNTLLTISANQTSGIDIEVIPQERFKPGIYLVSLAIGTNKGESYKEYLEVYIGTDEVREYAPALKTSVDVNERIDPREIQSIRLFLQNENPKDYPNLTITLQSDLSEFEKSQSTNLKPFESKTIEFTIEPNPFTQPKDYYLFFTIKQNDEIIKSIDKKVEIIPLTTDFTPKETIVSSFLKTVRTLTFTNDGNVRNEQTVKIAMNAFTDLFTSTDPDAYVLEDTQGRRYIAWDRELGVNEEFTVTVKTSYRIPIVVLIALIILIAIYLIYKSPVRINKAASSVIMHEGGVSALKITLVVRNLSNKVIKDVEVYDTAPSISSIEKDVEVGTLKPTDIKRNRAGGILLKWQISELEGKEERLITYKTKSKLDIVGTILLPRAKAKFKTHKGRSQVSYSNVYRVGGEVNKE